MAKKVTTDGEIVDELTHEIIARAPPFFKTPFNHDTNAESDACGTCCTDPSKTQQQFLKETDINHILAQFQKTGQLLTTGAPVYADQEEITDLQDRMVTGYEVEEAWNKLSPEVRNTLKNPATFASYVEHCLEVGDLEPLRALGLAKATEIPPSGNEPAPVVTRPTTPPGGSPAPESEKAAPAA